MSKFKEYQVVVNKTDLPKVPKGTKGTILIIHESGEDYEVEFIDNDGVSLNVLTVNDNDIVNMK